MGYALSELIDAAASQKVLDSFCDVAGVAAAIIAPSGAVLVGSRWQRICTDFHRRCPATLERCIESDTVLANKAMQGPEYCIYQCRNGLTDAASAVAVQGEHVANVFVGQFLLAPPNFDEFRARARRHGFDEDAYLEALREVPVISEADLHPILGFLVNFAEMVAAMGLERIRQLEVQRRLRDSEQRYRNVIDWATDALYLARPDGVLVDVNEAACEALDYTREELLRMRVHDVDPGSASGETVPLAEIVGSLQPRRPVTVETFHRRRDGATFPVEVRVGRLELGGEPFVLGLARDITDRKRAEEALRESEQRMELALLGGDLATWDWNVVTGEVLLNERWARMLGYEVDELEPSVDMWQRLLCPDDRAMVMEALEAHLRGETESYEVECRLRHKSGEWVWVLDKGRVIRRADDGAPLRACGTHLDITARKRQEEERERLESQLRQAQRMEAVGQLAGGVAHDFNNLLQAILGYGDMALDEIEEGSPAGEHVAEILKAGSRAAALVSQLLAFSRRQVLRMEDLDLNEVIADVMKMLRRVIGEHVTIEFTPGYALGGVRADRGQLEQILVNLCVNARDAMPSGGRLGISASNVAIGEEFRETHAWAEPGDYVLLTVTDTGCGMDQATLASAFEPFFTTKDVGQGTGLGLSTVYGLVKQHGGMVHAYSEVGLGTTMKVYLPRVEAESAQQSMAERPVAGGTETILLAEDDETVRRLSSAILQTAGYNVLTATDGEEALRVFAERLDDVDLVVLDVMMPKLGGRAVLERMRESRPGLRAVFASGYSMSAIPPGLVLGEDVPLVQKPATRNDLLRAVRKALDGR